MELIRGRRKGEVTYPRYTDVTIRDRITQSHYLSKIHLVKWLKVLSINIRGYLTQKLEHNQKQLQTFKKNLILKNQINCLINGAR